MAVQISKHFGATNPAGIPLRPRAARHCGKESIIGIDGDARHGSNGVPHLLPATRRLRSNRAWRWRRSAPAQRRRVEAPQPAC